MKEKKSDEGGIGGSRTDDKGLNRWLKREQWYHVSVAYETQPC